MNIAERNCDNINCNHNDTKGLCCLLNPDNCKYRQLQKENAELKADNDARRFAMAMSGKVEKQLREENAELKGLKDVATLIRANNDTVITLMQLNNMLVSKSQQLTKAKEIIKGLLSFVDSLGNYSGGIFNKAEQFLNSEVEK